MPSSLFSSNSGFLNSVISYVSFSRIAARCSAGGELLTLIYKFAHLRHSYQSECMLGNAAFVPQLIYGILLFGEPERSD